MNCDFCVSCPGVDYPECAVKLINNSILFESMIKHTSFEGERHLVCYKNALTIQNHKIAIGEKCDDCGLCKLSCTHNKDLVIEDKVEKTIFSNLGKLNIFLSSVFKSSLVGTEVKTSGNSRQKRIDAVIVNGKNVVLLKVLSNIDKYNFYYRSYLEIKKQCDDLYPEIEINIKMLIPTAKAEKAELLGYDYVCVKNIYEILK